MSPNEHLVVEPGFNLADGCIPDTIDGWDGEERERRGGGTLLARSA